MLKNFSINQYYESLKNGDLATIESFLKVRNKILSPLIDNESLTLLINKYQSSDINNGDMIHFLLSIEDIVDIEFNQKKIGSEVLLLASRKGCNTIVEKLVNNNTIEMTYKPLFEAIENRHTDVVRTLVEANWDINIKDSFNNTPLMIASIYNQYDTMDMLLHCGANVDCINNDNKTALYFAAQYNNIHCVNYLLEYNANMDIKNKNNNYTALDIAIQQEQYDIIKLISTYKNFNEIEKSLFKNNDFSLKKFKL